MMNNMELKYIYEEEKTRTKLLKLAPGARIVPA